MIEKGGLVHRSKQSYLLKVISVRAVENMSYTFFAASEKLAVRFGGNATELMNLIDKISGSKVVITDKPELNETIFSRVKMYFEESMGAKLSEYIEWIKAEDPSVDEANAWIEELFRELEEKLQFENDSGEFVPNLEGIWGILFEQELKSGRGGKLASQESTVDGTLYVVDNAGQSQSPNSKPSDSEVVSQGLLSLASQVLIAKCMPGGICNPDGMGDHITFEKIVNEHQKKFIVVYLEHPEDGLIGLCTVAGCTKTGKKIFLDGGGLFVAQEHQGRGIGEKLTMIAIAAACKKAGVNLNEAGVEIDSSVTTNSCSIFDAYHDKLKPEDREASEKLKIDAFYTFANEKIKALPIEDMERVRAFEFLNNLEGYGDDQVNMLQFFRYREESWDLKLSEEGAKFFGQIMSNLNETFPRTTKERYQEAMTHAKKFAEIYLPPDSQAKIDDLISMAVISKELLLMVPKGDVHFFPPTDDHAGGRETSGCSILFQQLRKVGGFAFLLAPVDPEKLSIGINATQLTNLFGNVKCRGDAFLSAYEEGAGDTKEKVVAYMKLYTKYEKGILGLVSKIRGKKITPETLGDTIKEILQPKRMKLEKSLERLLKAFLKIVPYTAIASSLLNILKEEPALVDFLQRPKWVEIQLEEVKERATEVKDNCEILEKKIKEIKGSGFAKLKELAELAELVSGKCDLLINQREALMNLVDADGTGNIKAKRPTHDFSGTWDPKIGKKIEEFHLHVDSYLKGTDGYLEVARRSLSELLSVLMPAEEVHEKLEVYMTKLQEDRLTIKGKEEEDRKRNERVLQAWEGTGNRISKTKSLSGLPIKRPRYCEGEAVPVTQFLPQFATAKQLHKRQAPTPPPPPPPTAAAAK